MPDWLQLSTAKSCSTGASLDCAARLLSLPAGVQKRTMQSYTIRRMSTAYSESVRRLCRAHCATLPSALSRSHRHPQTRSIRWPTGVDRFSQIHLLLPAAPHMRPPLVVIAVLIHGLGDKLLIQLRRKHVHLLLTINHGDQLGPHTRFHCAYHVLDSSVHVGRHL